ncbi:MAG: radical SAM protein, partial [archaeon]|nr:radical SAM protein [archaeon]
MRTINFVSVPTDIGSSGANVGIYYPTGLLSIATRINKQWPNYATVVDLTAGAPRQLITGEIVCISISSSLVYLQSIELAKEFKKLGRTIILGGAYVSQMFKQISKFKPDCFDFLIRGKAENTLVKLLQAIEKNRDFEQIPNLSFFSNGKVVHTQDDNSEYDWEQSVPIDLNILTPLIESYWKNYKERIDSETDYSFQVFTHFGCRYRDRLIASSKNPKGAMFRYCSFCGLNDVAKSRSPEKITTEIKHYLKEHKVPQGASIGLKCYGDNAATEIETLENLSNFQPYIDLQNFYNLSWIFYVQSLYGSERLFKVLKQLNTKHIYVGFDAVNDNVQKLNALGTSKQTHWNTVKLAKKYGIKIQAGFVLGLAGETIESLEEMLSFAKELTEENVLQRIIPSIVFIIPTSNAYKELVKKFPHINETDYIPYNELQKLWFDSFTSL